MRFRNYRTQLCPTCEALGPREAELKALQRHALELVMSRGIA